jgi:hypothetical protein
MRPTAVEAYVCDAGFEEFDDPAWPLAPRDEGRSHNLHPTVKEGQTVA